MLPKVSFHISYEFINYSYYFFSLNVGMKNSWGALMNKILEGKVKSKVPISSDGNCVLQIL